jgi:hypothetical protein
VQPPQQQMPVNTASAGPYTQPEFKVAPEHGYPAQRTPRSLRDQIAAALLAQTQDRLRT